MYDWQKKVLTDINERGKIYIDLPRGIGKRNKMNIYEKEDSLKEELRNISRLISDLDRLSHHLSMLGVEDCPLTDIRYYLNKNYGKLQKELSDLVREREKNINITL